VDYHFLIGPIIKGYQCVKEILITAIAFPKRKKPVPTNNIKCLSGLDCSSLMQRLSSNDAAAISIK
jgi:hypothetical protein